MHPGRFQPLARRCSVAYAHRRVNRAMTESTGSLSSRSITTTGIPAVGQRRDVGGDAVRRHDDPSCLLGDREIDVPSFFVLVLVGVAQHDGELVGDRGVLDATGNRREEGVLDVGDDQQPQVGALAAQVAGEVVWVDSRASRRPLEHAPPSRGSTVSLLFNARDTVATDTSASRATSTSFTIERAIRHHVSV